MIFIYHYGIITKLSLTTKHFQVTYDELILMEGEMMNIPSEKIFPTILIILDICAAIMYLPKKDIWNAGYWFSAAAISICVLCRK